MTRAGLPGHLAYDRSPRSSILRRSWCCMVEARGLGASATKMQNTGQRSADRFVTAKTSVRWPQQLPVHGTRATLDCGCWGGLVDDFGLPIAHSGPSSEREERAAPKISPDRPTREAAARSLVERLSAWAITAQVPSEFFAGHPQATLTEKGSVKYPAGVTCNSQTHASHVKRGAFASELVARCILLAVSDRTHVRIVLVSPRFLSRREQGQSGSQAQHEGDQPAPPFPLCLPRGGAGHSSNSQLAVTRNG